MENNVKNKTVNPFEFREVSKKEYFFEDYEKILYHFKYLHKNLA